MIAKQVPHQICTSQPYKDIHNEPWQNCVTVLHKMVPIRVSRQATKTVCGDTDAIAGYSAGVTEATKNVMDSVVKFPFLFLLLLFLITFYAVKSNGLHQQTKS